MIETREEAGLITILSLPLSLSANCYFDYSARRFFLPISEIALLASYESVSWKSRTSQVCHEERRGAILKRLGFILHASMVVNWYEWYYTCMHI